MQTKKQTKTYNYCPSTKRATAKYVDKPETVEPKRVAVAINVRKARELMRMSRRELSEMADVSEITIMKLETDFHSSFNFRTLSQVSEALGLDNPWVLTLTRGQAMCVLIDLVGAIFNDLEFALLEWHNKEESKEVYN